LINGSLKVKIKGEIKGELSSFFCEKNGNFLEKYDHSILKYLGVVLCFYFYQSFPGFRSANERNWGQNSRERMLRSSPVYVLPGAFEFLTPPTPTEYKGPASPSLISLLAY